MSRAGRSGAGLYLWLLTWAFTVFNTARVFSYLPTLWAIQRSGESNHHSLATWFVWFGSNLTMALWLYEHNGRALNRAIFMNEPVQRVDVPGDAGPRDLLPALRRA